MTVLGHVGDDTAATNEIPGIPVVGIVQFRQDPIRQTAGTVTGINRFPDLLFHGLQIRKTLFQFQNFGTCGGVCGSQSRTLLLFGFPVLFLQQPNSVQLIGDGTDICLHTRQLPFCRLQLDFGGIGLLPFLGKLVVHAAHHSEEVIDQASAFQLIHVFLLLAVRDTGRDDPVIVMCPLLTQFLQFLFQRVAHSHLLL